ncbi:MAG: hypothetical protein AUJ48_04400 [Deltaproteobacteria bacterium CG1_02_45_11]|nr:MAG: hypothetical protein AUJ48_04400 [Deltaproteobacteria bacterium CG1_02_45_11]
MSKIKILPEILSNKIAAGEVVERPASVVKELIENALDAGSTRIIIEVEKGGRSLIRVSDNGTGMNHDDTLLALERYATSKIYNDQDLFSISTLGFRGEALPSIAAVSRLTLVSATETSAAGTRVVVEGGKIKQVSEAGAPIGTMINVKQLFFNTPARRKFLKTINTEMSHIADIIAGIALGWPEVQFRLLHNGKIIKNWSATSDPVDRVADILGKDIQNDLYQIEFNDDYISVAGWTSSPRTTRSTSQGIYIYVNGRRVRDKVIQHALFEGYSQRLMKGRFPLAVIFIQIPFDQVDVNVHPTKNEVRFADQQRVHEAVKRAVSQTLELADRPQWTSTRVPEKKLSEKQPYVCESVAHYLRLEKETPWQDPQSSAVCPIPTIRKGPKTDLPPAPGLPAEQSSLWGKKFLGDLRIIGQLHNTYILCESDEGLVLIDQHAAHERILFEQLKKRSSASTKESQKLLMPEVMDLGYKEAGLLEKLIPDLQELGLEIEPFGGNTFVVKSIPAILEGREIKPIITEIVEKMVETGFTPGLEKAIDECLMLMACHGAIRANQPLSDKQMKALLSQLDKCENPSNCPHGRPTWIRWTKYFLEKSFKRIV